LLRPSQDSCCHAENLGDTKVDAQMRNINILSSTIVLLIATALPSYAQDPKDAIQKKLEADYAVTQPTADNTNIVTAGAVLVIKKVSPMMVPVATQNLYQNTYKDGKMNQNAAAKLSKWSHLPGVSSIPGATQMGTARTFVPGEKLWLTKIEVKDDGIVFSLLSDDIGDTRYKGAVKFVYPKGFFPAPDAAGHVVAEVFSIQPAEDAKGQAQPAQGGAAPAPQAAAPAAAEAPPAPIAPPPPPVDQPPPAPKTIALGQTPSQVTAIFGAPTKDIKLGAKEIYTYPDMKVTFVNGKVSDVQ
jgi:hypothetical protein